jgi:putative nucleotidyltransferase with HDIG domain
MTESIPNTQTIQKQLKKFQTVILNVTDHLAGLANPLASSDIHDLRNLSDSITDMQDNLSKQVRHSQRQMDALVGVGQIINSAMGSDIVLDNVMDTVIELMQAERGLIMFRNGKGEFLTMAARGMDQVNLEGEDFAVSLTIVRRVAESGISVLTTNAQEDPRFEMQLSVVEHNLRSIICVPLKLKDEIIGVIFVDSRMRSGLFGKNDLELLSAFANQAAVAIDNARLIEDLEQANRELRVAFEDLEQANRELTVAYDETVRGWALALELRDQETEGHTQRVTDLTLRLAKKLGVPEDELEHIRRGALLHDIGKMAIPDVVLLKPGGFNLTERKFMELHPEIAKDMLEKIEFLHPAIDIPYYHHEKWDGSGYPKNLRGENIPFAARIFAVADVWDALTSDRPYRKPLMPEEVRRIIRENSGSHFDPKVVEAFLELDDLEIPPQIGDTYLYEDLT